MTHLEIENLASEYLEESLDQVQQAQVEEHLAVRASCREVMEEIRSAIRTCHAAGSAQTVHKHNWRAQQATSL